MASVYVSWTGGIDGSVYIDVASETVGPFNSNSYYTVTLPDADGTYPVRPWCGSFFNDGTGDCRCGHSFGQHYS